MAENTPDARRPRLLTVAEAAAVMTISPRSVWALVAAGKLRRLKLGPRITRIDATDVDAFLAAARARSRAG